MQKALKGRIDKVEAQVENTTSTKPQSIVEQLLEIAKTHDAMDVIGGSTSWRWQEGLITRMPKIKTVTAILTKAFNSENPNVWIEETSGHLKQYLMSAYSVKDLHPILVDNIEDMFEVLFVYSLTDGRGSTYDELFFKF